MTDAPDSPRPWRGSGAGSNTIYDARDLWIGHVRSAAEVAFILRAVNSYDKMREAIEACIAAHKTGRSEPMFIAVEAAINTLKEIDNG